MPALADAVLPLIRSRSDLHRWSAANEHGRQMHDAVDLLDAAFTHEDAPVVLAVTQKAIASAISVILRSDDSSGIIGDAVRRLIAVHARGRSWLTLQRHFVRLELSTRPNGLAPHAFGRFEADAANQRWTGDALHGPTVGGRKAILFAFLDDHTRLLTGYRWARREDTVRLGAALHNGLSGRGIPDSVYLDNGSAMIDKQFQRACACLGIRLVHSRPGQPAGRGKIERFFRTVREQFLVEIGSGRELDDMTHLNTLFTSWVETVYHRRQHSETGQTPLQRWEQSWAATDPGSSPPRGPRMPSTGQLREAFLWSEWRTVTKTATVGLHANTYEVDAVLVGRKVELVFDPFDLTRIEVRWRGRSMGPAVPHVIGRHVHAKARPDDTTAPEAEPTGIDYLGLVERQHTAELVDRLQYSHLREDPVPDEPVPDGQIPGQLALPGTSDEADPNEVSA